jgi:hypothetical protein
VSKREPRIILKTEERTVVLELGTGEKFVAKSGGWDKNRVFLEGRKLVVEIKNGRWLLTHTPAGPLKGPEPVRHYFPTEE